ncbi:MAG: STM4011 family radical SAM protein [Peptococcaceae bacterium]|nr:STM4011 family radical SAM protein [Peptococcaceae bacterium]
MSSQTKHHNTIYYRGLLRSCNYRCSYCPFHKTSRSTHTKEEVYTKEETPIKEGTQAQERAYAKKEALDRERARDRLALEKFCAKVPEIGNNLSVMFVPHGEALIHSYYQEALAQLCASASIAKVGCQTNLSFSVENFLGHLGFSPKNQSRRDMNNTKSVLSKIRLWCTFHPTQTSLDQFLKQCQELYQNKILFSVGAVGLPKHTEILTELRRLLPRNIYLWINAAEGMNITYTQHDISNLLAIDPLFIYELQDHPAQPAHCRGGKESFFVEANGTIFPCLISRNKLGNIYDPQPFSPPPTSSSLPPNPTPVPVPLNHKTPPTPSKIIRNTRSCHCYLAYSNRTDIFDVCGLEKDRAFRIPNQQRAFFFDMDGTLTDISGTIPDKHLQAVDLLAETGLVFLATSLPFPFARQTGDKIWRYIAGGVFAEGSDIRIFSDNYKRIIPLNESVQTHMEASFPAQVIPYREDGILHKITLQNHAFMDNTLESPLQMTALRKHAEAGAKAFGTRFVLEDNTCGIVSKEASKLNGILEICKHLQLFESFVTVIGNSENDIPMLQHFADSVCVPGSGAAVKNAAKKVCAIGDLSPRGGGLDVACPANRSPVLCGSMLRRGKAQSILNHSES